MLMLVNLSILKVYVLFRIIIYNFHYSVQNMPQKHGTKTRDCTYIEKL